MVEHVHSATVAPRDAEDGPDPTDVVEPDPGAVFDAYGAETVDELVAAGRERLPDPIAEADDAQVAALFAGEVAAPAREGGCEDGGDAPRGSDRRSSGDGVEDAAASDLLADLERAVTTVDDGSDAARDSGADRSERREPDEEATDADVAAALDAAEAVYEGDLPDEVPFE